MGVCGSANSTVHSDSFNVTGSPLNAGKIAKTIAGGQMLVSSFPARYVMR